MTKNESLDLIKKGESENTEFKEKFDKEAIDTAVAFANTKGGIIFIGVTDKAKVKGIQTSAVNLFARDSQQGDERGI